jgi:PAS domain S-box-containing protein
LENIDNENETQYFLGMERAHAKVSENMATRRPPSAILERVFAASLDVMCCLDTELRIEYVNPACMEMWGYLPEELAGMPIQQLIHPEDWERTDRTLQAVMKGFLTRNLENRVIRRKGQVVPSLWSAVWLSADDMICCIVRDLTERKQMEAQRIAALQELGNFKRALDEHAIVAVTDALGRITYVNEKFCQISKYSREELLGQDHRIINSGYHAKEFIRHLWKTILAGKVWQGEIKNKAKDGTYYWVDTTIVPFLDDQGQPLQFVAIRADITQRKNAEAALLQTQKLESLGVLAGGIAHDFNNILTGVLGYADLANLSLPVENPAHAHLKQIESAALKAADLTRQLLAYAGKGKYVLADVDLNLMVQEMTQLLSVNISKKAVIRYELAPSIPAVPADPSQIQQVIMNLVTNASEAIGDEKSGVITIRTGVQILDELYVNYLSPSLPLAPGRYAVLEVTDSGCGMTPEVMVKIFDPFFTTKFTGRGLGLSAMMGILRSHQGSLKIYSEPGKGSTFKVFLPVVHAEEENAAEPPAPPLWSGQGTLLVVDDEPFARSVARVMAETLGFRIVEAADGREGLAIFEKMHKDIALVLMDLTMPNMDGREAFQLMHAISSSVPVVLSSGYSEQEAVSDFAGRGLAGFLPKPYQLALFRDTIREAIEKSRSLKA